LLAAGHRAELLSVLPHDRGRLFQANPDSTWVIDKSALGGNWLTTSSARLFSV
jgi:hypothetical protein